MKGGVGREGRGNKINLSSILLKRINIFFFFFFVIARSREARDRVNRHACPYDDEINDEINNIPAAD